MKQDKNPESIAIILDGNRRYARKRSLKPWQGHKFGAEKVKDILKWCQELGIKELTLYTFSMDNFKRAEKEKKALFVLFKQNIKKLKNDERLDKNGIRVRFIGRLQLFPKDIQEEMQEVMEKTMKNSNFKLNFAMAYSSKAEITDALKKIIQKIKNKQIDEKNINEELLNENLYLSSSPDILIRPGGEKRTSDFLLWQTAYSELFFVDKLWPEFTKQDLVKIIEDFKRRERRFGK
jgi:tritrans,polycis-undecaprenyl-diphosphate synthase [geranylgeranyl-diphosphate specific]|tara:strand:+ start:1109 stop:1813 length:705 start_codon:yes stop_codon:yes gene_type:complete